MEATEVAGEKNGPLQPKKKFTDGYTRFIKAANPSLDPVTTILRCHLLAEYYLDRLLIAALPRGDILTEIDSRFMFSDKVKMVESLDIIVQKVIDSLKKLNVVRNVCSHEQEYKVLESDIDKIGAPFGIKYIKEKRKCSDERELLSQTMMLLIASLDGQVEAYIETKTRE